MQQAEQDLNFLLASNVALELKERLSCPISLGLNQYHRERQMLDILLKIYSFISQIWSSLSQEQKDSICQAFVDLMDKAFREFFKANAGAAQ